MKTTLMYPAGDARVEDDPVVEQPTDALVPTP